MPKNWQFDFQTQDELFGRIHLHLPFKELKYPQKCQKYEWFQNQNVINSKKSLQLFPAMSPSNPCENSQIECCKLCTTDIFDGCQNRYHKVVTCIEVLSSAISPMKWTVIEMFHEKIKNLNPSILFREMVVNLHYFSL